MEIQDTSWFIKYAPLELKDLIFDNDEHKTLITNWMETEEILGNILFYGSFGLGKTITAEMIVRKIIKSPNDLFIARDRNVKEIKEKITPFLRKEPVKSKRKIVYMEEMDKLHPDAFNLLKTGLMEKHQHNCSFICCTNYIKKIEGAVLTRFTYKIPFTGNNVNGIFERMKFILDSEKATYDPEILKKFVFNNYRGGIRELINQLQNNFIANNGVLDFKSMSSTGSIEENIVMLIIKILGIVMKSDAKNKKLALDYPENSMIHEEYKQLCIILHNNIDINYDYIYSRIYEIVKFLPIKILCAKYSDNMEFKKFAHVNLLAFYYELLKIICEVNRI